MNAIATDPFMAGRQPGFNVLWLQSGGCGGCTMSAGRSRSGGMVRVTPARR